MQDRPREEWTGIPVPALVDEETFDRVQQRLQDNKRFASRNTKVPSLLQGIAACAACGYGYYRATTTTTAGNKIYYYRCLGSDDYRYQGGRVCGNKPVRADYADQVVWDHVTALLADPALIRAEIGKRLQRARTPDPVTRKRGQLEQALAKTATSIAAMITAFSEQLLTIDELRARLPALRARETGIKDQIAALDAQAADRDAYLRLAGDLESFLARLRGSAATATVEDRQRVLRAVVQDILIGPGKLTIRHRIPVREPSSGGGHQDTTDTEGDMRKSSLLRWGRDGGDLREAEDDRPGVPLPEALWISLESPFARVRIGAINELAGWLADDDAGRALTARQALEDNAAPDAPAVASVAMEHFADLEAQPEGRRAQAGISTRLNPRRPLDRSPG